MCPHCADVVINFRVTRNKYELLLKGNYHETLLHRIVVRIRPSGRAEEGRERLHGSTARYFQSTFCQRSSPQSETVWKKRGIQFSEFRQHQSLLQVRRRDGPALSRSRMRKERSLVRYPNSKTHRSIVQTAIHPRRERLGRHQTRIQIKQEEYLIALKSACRQTADDQSRDRSFSLPGKLAVSHDRL